MLFLIICICNNLVAQQNPAVLFVGTYTNKCDSNGIYVYDFNYLNGSAKLRNTTENVVNPSYLTTSPDRKRVYSVNENGAESKVSAFSYDQKNRKLMLLNQQNAGGADPCHIINDAKYVITANYSGGSISAFKKNMDGSMGKASQVVKFAGQGPNAARQEAPHAHMVAFSPDRKYVLSTDLGSDRIRLFAYYPNAETEVLVQKDSAVLKSGSGPRHLAFAPNEQFMYVLGELDGSINAFRYVNGKLEMLQETTIVQDKKLKAAAADIKISVDGRYLYATNRGDANTISTFSIDLEGKLHHKETISTKGVGPRNFTIDPSGKMLLIANQGSNEIVIFDRNIESGLLTDSGKRISVCQPVCLVFMNR